jgi:hypothetical protein
MSETKSDPRDCRAGGPNDNSPLTPANDNFEQRQEQRDRVLILLALHRRLEDIYPQSVEAVEIWALIDKLSYPAVPKTTRS